jgi:hypothetical protein
VNKKLEKKIHEQHDGQLVDSDTIIAVKNAFVVSICRTISCESARVCGVWKDAVNTQSFSPPPAAISFEDSGWHRTPSVV